MRISQNIIHRLQYKFLLHITTQVQAAPSEGGEEIRGQGSCKELTSHIAKNIFLDPKSLIKTF